MQTLKLEIETNAREWEREKEQNEDDSFSRCPRSECSFAIAQTTLYTALHHVELISTTFRSHFVCCDCSQTNEIMTVQMLCECCFWFCSFFLFFFFFFFLLTLFRHVAIVVLSKCVNILGGKKEFCRSCVPGISYAIDKCDFSPNEWPHGHINT